MKQSSSSDQNFLLKKEIESEIQWVNDIPAPLPGMYYIEPTINMDFKSHDDSLEKFLPPTIYTDPLSLIEIDYMKIVYDDLCANVEEEVAKSRRVYEEEYDYDSYIAESFATVNKYDHPIDKSIKVKNVYDVYDGIESRFVILQSEAEQMKKGVYTVTDNEHSTLYQYLVYSEGTCTYEGRKYTSNDYMVFKIEGDKVFYYDLECMFRFKPTTKKI